jgi:hypothetical protein
MQAPAVGQAEAVVEAALLYCQSMAQHTMWPQAVVAVAVALIIAMAVMHILLTASHRPTGI